MPSHSGTFFFDGRPALIEVASDDVWSGSAPSSLSSTTGLVNAWDGRLDNADDIGMRLGSLPASERTDASLALNAFERWGHDGLAALTGEWSAAIWDRPSKALYLARDWMGVRPLYYCVDADGVHWSTNLRQLVVHCARQDCLSDGFIARFMSLRFRGEVTPYEGIFAVPAGCCLTFTSTPAVVRRRLSNLSRGTLRYRDNRQYEEHLRALWTQAVAARLRTNADVWAELSGGLDSSSVVCMADALIKAGRVPARRVHPLSHVTLHSPEGDERRFIAEVEGRLGAGSEILGVEAHEGVIDPECDWVTPHAVRGVSLAGDRLIRNRGGRVVMSGRAGDVVMGCEPDNSVAVLDDFAQGRPLTAISKMRRWSRASRTPFIEIAYQLAGGKERNSHAGMDGLRLLTPRLAQMALPDDAERARALTGIRASKRRLAESVLAYAFEGRLTVPEPPPDIVYTYPFTDRRLIEFVLAIPGEQLSAPGQIRSLMRRAFEGLVPARVLHRTSKGYYPPATNRAARPLIAAMRPVERLEIVQRGWIDPRRLDAAIRMVLEAGLNDGGAVRRALRLEQWLESKRVHGVHGFNPERKEVRSHEVLHA
jgi:asparagine synthase (glutamine-hydrolysing)